MNWVLFEYPYDQINPMENINDENHLIDTHDYHNREDAKEEENFEYVNDTTGTEE